MWFMQQFCTCTKTCTRTCTQYIHMHVLFNLVKTPIERTVSLIDWQTFHKHVYYTFHYSIYNFNYSNLLIIFFTIINEFYHFSCNQ